VLLRQLVAAAEAAPRTGMSLVARQRLQLVRLAILDGDPAPEFTATVDAMRQIGEPYWLATALLEHAEWLTASDRPDEAAPLLAEAHVVFERLRATPRLERVMELEQACASRSASAPASA
jgi:hypothetical protein